MVAKITIKNSLQRNFYYNENKVEQNVATCIAAENYPRDLDRLTQASRLKMLQKTASMNEAIKVNTLHVSLNFHPSEKLEDGQLTEIAKSYMERIGFGEQPYLVYRHFDAGHPHIHILSVKVRMDGTGINTHYIGIKKSEPARKELEQEFKLVRAEDMKKQPYYLKPACPQKVQYGRSESRRAISNVLEGVLMHYKYTSLAELNAVLKQYNVMANRCSETSKVYLNKGLLYHILNEQGKPVGVPIKASSFYNNPGLKFLEERFKVNELSWQPLKRHVKNAIDLYMVKQQKPSLNGLIKALEREGIHTVLRQNEAGIVYDITYVDHRHKTVFNGSQLGKQYSAKSIPERCGHTDVPAKHSLQAQASNTASDKTFLPVGRQATADVDNGHEKTLMDLFMQPENTYQPVPYQLKKTRKKKRRKRLE